jgi:hypothetical protein
MVNQQRARHSVATPGAESPKLASTAVVYNAKDGRVALTFPFVTMGSVDPPTDEVMERDALKLVTGTGGKFAVLHHRVGLLNPASTYQVDVANARLIEIAGPPVVRSVRTPD